LYRGGSLGYRPLKKYCREAAKGGIFAAKPQGKKKKLNLCKLHRTTDNPTSLPKEKKNKSTNYRKKIFFFFSRACCSSVFGAGVLSGFGGAWGFPVSRFRWA